MMGFFSQTTVTVAVILIINDDRTTVQQVADLCGNLMIGKIMKADELA